MTAPASTAPAATTSTLAEVSAFDRFRAAELQSIAAQPVGADEMIDVALSEGHRLCASARAAEVAYGSPYDAGVVRRVAVLGKIAEFLGLVHQHRDEIMPILRGSAPAAKRARRG